MLQNSSHWLQHICMSFSSLKTSQCDICIYVVQRLRVKQDKVQFTAENYSVLCVWFVVCGVCVVCGVWWMCGLCCVCVCGLWCVCVIC